MKKEAVLMPDEFWMLVFDKGGVVRKLFLSEEAARKTATKTWYNEPRQHGGILWHLVDGETWKLVEDIPGFYNPARRGLYK